MKPQGEYERPERATEETPESEILGSVGNDLRQMAPTPLAWEPARVLIEADRPTDLVISSPSLLASITQEVRNAEHACQRIMLDHWVEALRERVIAECHDAGIGIDLRTHVDGTYVQASVIDGLTEPIVRAIVRIATFRASPPPHSPEAPPPRIHLVCRTSEALLTLNLVELEGGIDSERLRTAAAAPQGTPLAELLFDRGEATFAEEVDRLGGSLRIDAERGEGIAIEITLPQNRYRIAALLVAVDDEEIAIPQTLVLDTLVVGAAEIEFLPDGTMILEQEEMNLRLHAHPMSRHQPHTIEAAAGNEPIPIVIVGAGERIAGIIVDEILGAELVFGETFLEGSFLEGDEVCAASITMKGKIVTLFHPQRWLRSEGAIPRPLFPAEQADGLQVSI
ncbi:MAG: hypothetical protein D6812_05995 [Deltaproteobacteria bacterium]|nr:MAG: hypothetical protein D6812_05995 [Deltaproteobacteria bacterium]